MTTEALEVVVTERGARDVEEAIRSIAGGAETAGQGVKKLDGQLEDTGKTANKTSGIMTTLKGAIVGIAVGIGVRGVMALADSYSVMGAQVRRVTGSVGEFKAVNSALYDVARETGSGIQDVTNQYVSLATATKGLGTSQETVIGVTKALNDMMEAAGASAGATTTAVETLSLGLARGTITTREYTTLMRNSKGLFGDVIASEMGITTQALDEMVRSGQLSAEKLVSVMDQSRGAFAALAADMPMTFGKAITILGTSFTQLIGQLNESTGVLQVFYGAIVFAANNLEMIASILTFGAVAWGIYRAAIFAAAFQMTATSVAAGVLQLALGGVSAVLAFIAANPLVTLVTALGLGVAALLTFGSETAAARTLLDHLGAAMTVLGALVGAVWSNAIKPAWEAFKDIVASVWGAMVKFGEGVLKVLASIARAIGLLIPRFGALGTTIEKMASSLTAMYAKSLADSAKYRADLERERAALNNKSNAVNGVSSANDNARGAVDRTTEATNALTSALGSAGATGTSAFDGIATSANRAASAVERASQALGGQSGSSAAQSQGIGKVGNAGAYQPGSSTQQTQSTSGGTRSGSGVIHTSTLPGFARGGGFKVGGENGRDRNIVAFKASRGEEVQIKTPAQQKATEQTEKAGVNSVVIEEINLYITGVQNPNDFRNTERQIMRSLQGALSKAVR